MALYVYPLDNWQLDGAKYTGRRLRQMLGGLFTGHTAGRPLGARSGVVAGTPTSTVTVVGTTWSVAPHTGVLDVKTAAIAGPYMYALDVAATGTVPAANASQDRVDLIVVQVSDPTEGDGTSTPAVALNYVTGTPGAGLPATPAGSLALALVAVPKSGGGSPYTSWLAPFTVANGGILPCKDATAYPSAPYPGMFVYNLSLDALVRWNGSTWRSATDDFPQYETGSVIVASVAGQSSNTKAVSFAKSWSTPPLVLVTARNNLNWSGYISGSPSTSGFTAGITKNDGTNAGGVVNFAVDWVAFKRTD